MRWKTQPHGSKAAALVVLAAAVLGIVIGFAAPMLGGTLYRSSATVTFTAVQLDDRPPTVSEARHILVRMPSWVKIVGSGEVAGEFPLRAGESLSAVEISGVNSFVLSLTSPTAQDLPARTTAAANAVITVITRGETPAGTKTSRVRGTVTDPGDSTVSLTLDWAMWGAVLGAVIGALLGWLVCALRAPGRWVEQLAGGGSREVAAGRPADSEDREVGSAQLTGGDDRGVGAASLTGGENREVGAASFAESVDVELRRLASAVRTRRGFAVLALLAVAVGGYVVTGSAWPVFLATLVAGVVSRKDPRWIAVAVVVLGATVLPEKLDLVKIGPVTPTVLEVALLIGIVVVWRRPQSSVFTWPLVGVTAAVLVGCLWGFAHGGDFSVIADTARALLIVPLGFFVVHRAFAGRLPQLVAIVSVGAAVASVVELAASALHIQRLLVDERTSVITGTDTSEVSRLSAPILPLWGPLLILLVSGAFPTKPRWRYALLVLPGVLHEALSFNRSTWAPLLACVVLVAVARFGARGVVKRLIVAAAAGGLALGLAGAGAFGSTGEALANRVTSVFSGKALAEDSLADRERENNAAMATLRQHPLTGTGVGVPYGGEIVSYDDLHDRTVVEARPWIHNQYLRMWLWFGGFGLLMIGLLMVRVASVVVHSWRERAPATVPVVAFGLGLACLAFQSVLQTTLIDRPTLTAVALTLAMLGNAVSWRSVPFAQVARTSLPKDRIMTR
ncbi:O-antigen ligase family protein [Actinocrispum wychmicini]|uniref:O-antigen ligase n=1 Tax=Actinocrispum wychmicini TaxID=1213861 RepID=A0A4R2K5Q3_9PSEU|nr:O-antigen ligase family protein [Actinocrispum wychmicini]TCO65128.1 O-antigen ligase [Actinocrispum wychmicini]